MSGFRSSEADWLNVDTSYGNGDESDTGSMMDTPMHPLPAMQGAFEESMAETMADVDESEMEERASMANSVHRRKVLLEQAKYERTVAGRWKQKAGEKYHPLVKLVAQISFGMHLLQQGMAKSENEVINILQTHVDEVDGFLERTTEDLDLAQEDIEERLAYLRVPLKHGEVFDNMLNDKAFRTAIIEGNEKIEHILERTASAMNDALKDIQKGFDSTRELARYLAKLNKAWPHRSEEHGIVFSAMVGNTEGWSAAFIDLQKKGGMLNQSLVDLEHTIADLQRWAGIASRRNLTRSTGNSVDLRASLSSRRSFSPPHSPLKIAAKETRKSLEPARRTDSPLKDRSMMGTSDQHSWQSNGDLVKPAMDIAAFRDLTMANASPPDQPTHLKSMTPPHSARSLKQKVPESSTAEPAPSRIRQPPSLHDSDPEESDTLGPLPDLEHRADRYAPRSSGLSGLRAPSPPKIDLPLEIKEDPTVSPMPASGSPLLSTIAESPSSVQSTDDRSTPASMAATAPVLGEGRVNLAHPLLQDIRAREVHFTSKNNGTPLKPVLKDLPLRQFRSQDSEVKTSIISGTTVGSQKKTGLVRSSSLRSATNPARTASPALSQEHPTTMTSSPALLTTKSPRQSPELVVSPGPSTSTSTYESAESHASPSSQQSSHSPPADFSPLPMHTVPAAVEGPSSSIFHDDRKPSLSLIAEESETSTPRLLEEPQASSPLLRDEQSAASSAEESEPSSPSPEDGEPAPRLIHEEKQASADLQEEKQPSSSLIHEEKEPAEGIHQDRPPTMLEELTSACVTGPESDVFPYDCSPEPSLRLPEVIDAQESQEMEDASNLSARSDSDPATTLAYHQHLHNGCSVSALASVSASASTSARASDSTFHYRSSDSRHPNDPIMEAPTVPKDRVKALKKSPSERSPWKKIFSSRKNKDSAAPASDTKKGSGKATKAKASKPDRVDHGLLGLRLSTESKQKDKRTKGMETRLEPDNDADDGDFGPDAGAGNNSHFAAVAAATAMNAQLEQRDDQDEDHGGVNATKGFVGVGRDGVWITRRNFLKA